MVPQFNRLNVSGRWKGPPAQSLLLLVLLVSLRSALSAPTADKEHVILVHGLCRTSRSMVCLERALVEAGYQVLNVNYPSRSASTERLSEDAIGAAVAKSNQA